MRLAALFLSGENDRLSITRYVKSLSKDDMFPIIEVFGLKLGAYGIMVVVGFLVCSLVASRLIKRFGINMLDFGLVMICACIVMTICACLLFGLTNIRLIIAAFSHIGELGFEGLMGILKIAFGGLVFYGGFIGGALGILIYTRFSKPMRPKRDGLLDVYAVLVPLFHGFGRIGCFLAGCCYGIESEFGFTAHGNELNPTVNDVNRFPVQLVESGCNFILFFVLLMLFKKAIMDKRLIYIYMLAYPVVRFSLEFLRGDTYRGILFGLSTSQWISIILFLFSIVMLIRKNKIMKKEAAVQAIQTE